ncbi:MAG: NAD(P)/FAD-dependent oxidoreductase, partial [Elusimicrobiota bacterium]|nr:NAD(P)/FAD-dependent oxidoreductase [Elusimicrobiota bacterium]
FNAFAFKPRKTAGFDKAEITAGGVDTGGLSSKTMMARNIDGLYFIGEALDVSGRLGGFNLHFAWAGAFAAARNIVK